jgi:hypothetical protein
LRASSFYIMLPLLSLLSALALAALVTCVFGWLRHRLPDFARGYRSGSLIAAIIFGAVLLWWNIHMVSGMIETRHHPLAQSLRPAAARGGASGGSQVDAVAAGLD